MRTRANAACFFTLLAALWCLIAPAQAAPLLAMTGADDKGLNDYPATALPEIKFVGGEAIRIAGLVDQQHGAVFATLLGTVVLLYFWHKVGRDPQGGAIHPQFEPPNGIGPAAVRYIYYQGYDDGCLTTAIISLAVKGALRIEEGPSSQWRGGHSLWLKPLSTSGETLTLAERATYLRLFPTGKSLELVADKTNGKRMDQARHALHAVLREEHYGASFISNSAYTLTGGAIGVGAAALLLHGSSYDASNPSQFMPWLTVALFSAWLTATAGVLATFLGYYRSGGFRIPPLPASVWGGLSALVALLFWVADNSASFFSGPADPTVMWAGAAYGVILVVFHVLMAAPTKSGRRLLDRIRGFALYLGTAEEERLNMLTPPIRTPERFEQLLPYAIALDLAHEWGARFGGILSTTSLQQWYRGGRGFSLDLLNGELGQLVSSTSMPAKRRFLSGFGGFGGGGSGGGGFSGGGGGGGGGGSW